MSSLLNNLNAEKPTPLQLAILSSDLKNVTLDSGATATIFEALATADTKLTRLIMGTTDNVADEPGLDDPLLDSILVELGLE